MLVVPVGILLAGCLRIHDWFKADVLKHTPRIQRSRDWMCRMPQPRPAEAIRHEFAPTRYAAHPWRSQQ